MLAPPLRALIFTPWVMDRSEPLEVYGPKGIKAMTAHVLAAWQIDIDTTLALSERSSGDVSGR